MDRQQRMGLMVGFHGLVGIVVTIWSFAAWERSTLLAIVLSFFAALEWLLVLGIYRWSRQPWVRMLGYVCGTAFTLSAFVGVVLCVISPADYVYAGISLMFIPLFLGLVVLGVVVLVNWNELYLCKSPMG